MARFRLRAPPGTDEHNECAIFYQWCVLNRVPCVHVPNEGQRTVGQHMRLKKIGLQKGFPDFLIPVPRGGKGALYVEMKANGRKPTAEQLLWIALLNKLGNEALWAGGAAEAIGAAKRYLGI